MGPISDPFLVAPVLVDEGMALPQRSIILQIQVSRGPPVHAGTDQKNSPISKPHTLIKPLTSTEAGYSWVIKDYLGRV